MLRSRSVNLGRLAVFESKILDLNEFRLEKEFKHAGLSQYSKF